MNKSLSSIKRTGENGGIEAFAKKHLQQKITRKIKIKKSNKNQYLFTEDLLF